VPQTLASTPREDGFRMPGEFENKQGCWMIWPERPDTWRLGAKPARWAFVEVASAIAESSRSRCASPLGNSSTPGVACLLTFA
jgi:agmatine deiminase